MVVFSKPIEDIDILLSWQAFKNNLDILLRRNIVFKVNVWNKLSQLVQHDSRIIVSKEKTLLEH